MTTGADTDFRRGIWRVTSNVSRSTVTAGTFPPVSCRSTPCPPPTVRRSQTGSENTLFPMYTPTTQPPIAGADTAKKSQSDLYYARCRCSKSGLISGRLGCGKEWMDAMDGMDNAFGCSRAFPSASKDSVHYCPSRLFPAVGSF